MHRNARDNILPPAIVVGLDDTRGVHAARTLAQQGVSVSAITRDRKSYACRTNACREILVADTRSADFVELLERRGPTFATRPVLVPALDMAALQISRHRERLAPWYNFSLPPAESVETLMDKVAFYRFAEQSGLPIPKTCFLAHRGDIEQAAGALRFPFAVKPPNSKLPQWLERTAIKAFHVRDVDELRDVFDAYHDVATPLIVQEWIAGPESALYACHCCMGREGEVLAHFTSRKIRQWPPHTGQGCLAVGVENDSVREIAVELFRRAGVRGLGYVEVKQDQRTGEYLIVEPNIGRVSGRMAIAEAGGVALLYTAYCEAAGLPLPENRQPRYTGAKWIFLRQDLQSAWHYMRRGELSLGQWWKSIRGRKKFALLSWRDPGPFIADLFGSVRKLMNAGERRRRKPRRAVDSLSQPPGLKRLEPASLAPLMGARVDSLVPPAETPRQSEAT